MASAIFHLAENPAAAKLYHTGVNESAMQSISFKHMWARACWLHNLRPISDEVWDILTCWEDRMTLDKQWLENLTNEALGEGGYTMDIIRNRIRMIHRQGHMMAVMHKRIGKEFTKAIEIYGPSKMEISHRSSADKIMGLIKALYGPSSQGVSGVVCVGFKGEMDLLKYEKDIDKFADHVLVFDME